MAGLGPKRRQPIIAIDGPAGAGKSTVARLLAKKLDMVYLDTGSMYRSFTAKVLGEGLVGSNLSEIEGLAQRSIVRVERDPADPHRLRVLLDGEDLSDEIRSPEVSEHVSLVSSIPAVRTIMTEVQREVAREGGVIVEGRDIGTEVLPDADFKFYITASFEERCRRRLKELRDKDYRICSSEVKENIRHRDEVDSGRDVGALRMADDAIAIDTTGMSVEQVVEAMLRRIREGSGDTG